MRPHDPDARPGRRGRAPCAGAATSSPPPTSPPAITNIATRTPTRSASDTESTSNPATVTVPLVSALTLQKSSSPRPPYAVGQQVAYSYALTNTGGSTLYNVAVTTTGSRAGRGSTAPANTLAPGGHDDVHGHVHRATPATSARNGVLVNTAHASAQTSIGQQVPSNQSSGQINVFTDVGVTKTVDNATPLVGSERHVHGHGDEPRAEPRRTGRRHRPAPVGPAACSSRPRRPPARLRPGDRTVEHPQSRRRQSATLPIVATVQTRTPRSRTRRRAPGWPDRHQPGQRHGLGDVKPTRRSTWRSPSRSTATTSRSAIRPRSPSASPTRAVAGIRRDLVDLLPAALRSTRRRPAATARTIPSPGSGRSAISRSAPRRPTPRGHDDRARDVHQPGPAADVHPTRQQLGQRPASATLTVRARNADLYIPKARLPPESARRRRGHLPDRDRQQGPRNSGRAYSSPTSPRPGSTLSTTVIPNVVTVDRHDHVRPRRHDPLGRRRPRLRADRDRRPSTPCRTPGTKVNTSKIDAPNLIDPTPKDNSDTASLIDRSCARWTSASPRR